MKDYPIFLASEISQSPIEEAGFTILPVPYEKTVSYSGGTAQGPLAILEASSQLETWDGKSNPSTLGIHTLPAVNCQQNPAQVIDDIAKATKDILQVNSFPIALGGEHTVTYGVIKGYLEAGIKDFGIVQIDAHADLREAYEGDTLNHASVMKRIADEGIPIFQLGVRAYCEEEMRTRESQYIHFIDADELVPNNIQSISLPKNFPKKVFFTVDVDGIDPSIFPSTGTPVPGGLSWYQTLNLFESVAKQCEIIGFDIMEFSPIKGFHAYDFSAALLTYKLMGIIQRYRKI